jgi:predicted nucleotidyltransferase
MEEIHKLTHFHDSLNSDLWRHNHLRSDVQVKLLQIAYEFVKFINIKNLAIKDVTLSGSNASFNYTDQSDIDLHLIVRYNTSDEKFQELFDAKKKLFNKIHDITIKGHDVEVYVQPADDDIVSNGVYSVLKEKWIKHPKKITDIVDETNIQAKFNSIRRAIIKVLKDKDYDGALEIKAKIKKMRAKGLASSGEFGAENLAVKAIRNSGYMNKLMTFIDHRIDKNLSLESIAESKEEVTGSDLWNLYYMIIPDGTDGYFASWQHDNFPYGKTITLSDYVNIIEKNKKTIIINILKSLKDPEAYDKIMDAAFFTRKLEQLVDWPELEIIERSLAELEQSKEW